MCDKGVKDDLSSLWFVPDWFVTQEQIDVWYDDDHWYTMMVLLNGTMVIKNERPRQQK